jgi:hypothetical protein
MRAREITATIKKATGAKNLSVQNAALPAVLSALHAFASTRATRALFARGRGDAVLEFASVACLDPRTATLLAPLASGAPARRARRSTRRTLSPRAQSCALACALAASSAVALYVDAAERGGGVSDATADAALEAIRLLVQTVKLCDDDGAARRTPLAALADAEREHIALAATKAAFDAVVSLNTAVSKFGAPATRQRFTSLVCALGESALHSTHANVPIALAAIASRHAVRKPADAWVLGYCAILATSDDGEQQKAAKRALALAAKLISKRRARDVRAAKNPRALAECVALFCFFQSPVCVSVSPSLSLSLSRSCADGSQRSGRAPGGGTTPRPPPLDARLTPLLPPARSLCARRYAVLFVAHALTRFEGSFFISFVCFNSFVAHTFLFAHSVRRVRRAARRGARAHQARDSRLLGVVRSDDEQRRQRRSAEGRGERLAAQEAPVGPPARDRARRAHRGGRGGKRRRARR